MSNPLTIKQIAAAFAVYEPTIYRWIDRGLLPRVIYPHELAAHIQRLTEGVTVTTAAERIGKSPVWVRHLIKTGALTVINRDARPIRITEQSIANYLKRRETK